MVFEVRCVPTVCRERCAKRRQVGKALKRLENQTPDCRLASSFGGQRSIQLSYGRFTRIDKPPKPPLQFAYFRLSSARIGKGQRFESPPARQNECRCCAGR